MVLRRHWRKAKSPSLRRRSHARQQSGHARESFAHLHHFCFLSFDEPFLLGAYRNIWSVNCRLESLLLSVSYLTTARRSDYSRGPRAFLGHTRVGTRFGTLSLHLSSSFYGHFLCVLVLLSFTPSSLGVIICAVYFWFSDHAASQPANRATGQPVPRRFPVDPFGCRSRTLRCYFFFNSTAVSLALVLWTLDRDRRFRAPENRPPSPSPRLLFLLSLFFDRRDYSRLFSCLCVCACVGSFSPLPYTAVDDGSAE